MSADVSEYEAKRLRRIAENRQKLQEFNISTLAVHSPPKPKCEKRKRDVDEKTQEPTRRSSRQRKKQNLEKELSERELLEWKLLQKEANRKKQKRQKIAKKIKKTLKLEWKKFAETLEEEQQSSNRLVEERKLTDQEKQEHEEVHKHLDWRLRRKLQAREKRTQMTLKQREERRALRLKEMKKKIKMKKRERKLRLKQKEDAKLAREVQKELERQQRVEEREQMREEDRLARRLAKQRVNDVKQQQVEKTYAIWNQNMQQIFMDQQKRTREKENEWNQKMYPIQRINLPFVRISDSIATTSKPLVVTPLLKVDVNLFHAFSLRKQFLPPGKTSVMQGLCPGGYTPVFHDNLDLHVWENAMTLFVNSTTGIFYQSMFKETLHHGRKYVSFRWTRCLGITPSILWRLCRMQKGDEFLCVEGSDPNAPQLAQEPEALLLFIQYPKGPYIYCGRLGYLGHHATPLEFSFQLLDINALNWSHLHTLLISADYSAFPMAQNKGRNFV